MLPGLEQGTHDEAAEDDARQHHQHQRQQHRADHGHDGALETLARIVYGLLLLLADVFGELTNGLDEGRAARRAVLVVHHVEGGVVLAAQGLDHGVHAVVDIRAVAAHEIHGQLAAGIVLQHILLEFTEAVAHPVEQIGGVLQRLGGGLARVLAAAPAGLLQMTRGHHERNTGAQHVAVDDLDLLGAVGQIVDLLHGLVVLLQKVCRHRAQRGDQKGEKAQQAQQQGADMRIAQGK
ncbi:NAD-specific glutamate dehydrogenase [Bordetella pseudohinzii]